MRGGVAGGRGGQCGGEEEERGKAVTRSNLPAPRPRRQPGGAAAGPASAERAP